MNSPAVQQVLDLLASDANVSTVIRAAGPVLRSADARQLALNKAFVNWCCKHWREIDVFDKAEPTERTQP